MTHLEYYNMTTQEFAQKIKTKYPQYQNIDDNELVQKITTKYPQYKSQVDTQPSQSTPSPEEKKSPFDLKKGGDILAFPKVAAQTGLGIAKSAGRVAARPFIQTARGIQQAIPGGKTGTEDITLPGLGTFRGDKTGLPPIRETGVELAETTMAGFGGAILRPIASKFRQLKRFITDKRGQKIIKEIEDTISPKLTTRETQIASQEGRIIRTPESKIFGKKPDIVIQSDKVKKAANTVQRRIPNAGQMDDQVLNSSINSKITSSARTLKPNLQKINVNPEKTTKLKSAWDDLKIKQTKNPEFDAFAGAKKSQSNFESFLNEVNKPVKDATGKFRPKTLDDIWDIRKRYDDSISDAVKQADNLSAPSTQLQKDMWLDNRRILNDLMEEMSQGLNQTTKQAFDEMSDLYTARQNIIGKTAVDKKGTPGIFTFKNLLKATGAGVLGKYLID